MYCKNCNSEKLRKELVSPFDQMGWYICENCLMAGPLWLVAQHERKGVIGVSEKVGKFDAVSFP